MTKKPIVMAELSDGSLVALPAEAGASVEEVATAIDTQDARDWIVADNGGCFRAGRVVGLWPADRPAARGPRAER